MSDRVPGARGSASDSTLPKLRRRRLGQLTALALACGGVAAISSTLVAAPSSAGSAEPTGVILVSWDGTRYDILKELMHWQPISDTPHRCPGDEGTPAAMPTACGDYWTCLPTICQFQMMESKVAAPGKTLTRVQHAAMLTGTTPAENGVNTNNGSSSVPYGFTIYERLSRLVGNGIQFAHVGSYRFTVRGILGWVKGSIVPSENIATRGRPDKYTGEGSNENFLPMLQRFDADKPFFAFEHQKGPDLAGHALSDHSPEYRIAIVAADRRLKELLDELTRLGMSERTHVFVTTDHGFWQSQHLGALRPVVRRTWIASQKDNLLCYTVGNVIDVVPTILATFGVDPAASIPSLLGRSLLDPSRTGECVPPVCGNGVIEVGEDCEPTLASTDTCESLGFLRGNLACGDDCNYNTSDCADELAATKLAINRSPQGGVDITIKVGDRYRGGPSFNPLSDAVGVEVTNGASIVWEGGTENYDPGWRVYGDRTSWIAARGSRTDGLVAVSMSGPANRMRMQVNAGSVAGLNDFLDLTSVRTIIRVGEERFDANLPCHLSFSLTGLRCAYDKPVSELRDLRHEHHDSLNPN